MFLMDLQTTATRRAVFLILLSVGSVLSGADVHVLCLPELWTPGVKVTIQCVVQRSSYPSKCTTTYTNTTLFRQKKFASTFQPKCTVKDILGSCQSEGSCGCGTHNATHYKFQYELTADRSTAGYWDCNVPCFAGLTTLTIDNYDCDNRKVVEVPTPTCPE